MNSSFLEANNITTLINTVRSNVKQEINYDITQEPTGCKSILSEPPDISSTIRA